MNKDNQLRGYIPISAPLNWEPCTGSEKRIRPVIGFTTNWYNKRLGIDFGEKFHSDPYVRFEALFRMKRYLQDTFPKIEYFFEHDNPFEQECGTISGVYGVCFFAMVYGMEATYYSNNWPAIKPGNEFNLKYLSRLGPLDLNNNKAVEGLFKQMDTILKEWGAIDGYINYQGVINNAFKLRGSSIFLDMIEEPDLCDLVFDNITDTMIKLIEMIHVKQRSSGFYIDNTCVGNCVVNMISPDMYERFILPKDILLGKTVKNYGVHTCNWTVDPYVEKLSTIENLRYIDFGFDSNIKKIKKYIPSARRCVFYNPQFLMSKKDNEIESDISRINDECAPCDLCLADIDLFIPDERVNHFNKLLEKHNN
jgi:hypothetical protein